MEETATQGIISPVLADTLLFLNLTLSIILLFAFAYLFTTRHQTGEIAQLKDRIKKLSGSLKALEEKFQEIKPPKKVDTVPEPDAFGMSFAKKEKPAVAPKIPTGNQVWSKFIDDYNHIAGSMLVPGQLQACQKFVEENNLRMLMRGITGNFLGTNSVEESNFWAWKINDSKNFAVVPNPMKPCTGDLYEEVGLKSIFAMNFENGVYKKYEVKVPAIFTTDENNRWQLKDPGVVDLSRQ
ncbi:MAG: hypothetical protein IJU55_00675 [Selenomonadaceae bacterium]|nr:hypothetical protein [Selenomonadaceae bacterium]